MSLKKVKRKQITREKGHLSNEKKNPCHRKLWITRSFQISLELQEHSAYKIFLFPRGWFYDKRTQQKLEFIDVRKGENVKIQLSLQVRSSLPEQKIWAASFQQMQKLHIDEFYRKTVPDGTPDCEPDPGFNYDKAYSIASSLLDSM